MFEEGPEMKTSFGIAKVTHPLLSVHLMVENGHDVKISKTKNFINTQTKQPEDQVEEGRLTLRARSMG